jgi:imidazolonepropionase-like amidohydrolase
MRRPRVLAAVLVAAALLLLRFGDVSAHARKQATTVLALVGGKAIPSPDAAPIPDATVLIENGRISAIGPLERVKVPQGATTLACRGLVVVAGLQNSHAHFTESQWIEAAGQPAEKLTRQLRDMLTAWGFTTVVDTGSFLQNTVALRRRIDAREVPGPRILTAGVPLYPPNGIPYYLKDGSIPPDLMKLMPQPATPADAVAAVDQDVDGGADIIKLFTGSWVARGRVLPMPVDVASAAVREAHRRGRLVFAHTSRNSRSCLL